MRYTCYLLTFLVLASCTASRQSYNTGSKDLVQLRDLMAGHFNSAAQAQRDTDYYDITLRMTPIWADRSMAADTIITFDPATLKETVQIVKSNGYWLYVEQAVTANQAKPYRQRVYQLEQVNANTFKSSVYILKDEKAWVNAWQSPEKFKAWTTADIELKAGCEVVLKKMPDGSYSGATGDRTCPSELRGAKFANSKVTIKPGLVLSWDQGFDAAGKQVWGATKGGYEFVKQ